MHYIAGKKDSSELSALCCNAPQAENPKDLIPFPGYRSMFDHETRMARNKEAVLFKQSCAPSFLLQTFVVSPIFTTCLSLYCSFGVAA